MPESIDERALNVPQQPGNALGDKAATENSMLCLNAAKALGCPLNAVTAEDLAAGQVTVPLCLVFGSVQLSMGSSIFSSASLDFPVFCGSSMGSSTFLVQARVHHCVDPRLLGSRVS